MLQESAALGLERAGDQRDGALRPLGDRCVKVGELGLGHVDAAGGHRRAELDQHGAQVGLPMATSQPEAFVVSSEE